MKKKKIFTKEGPEPVGPYSQAIKISDFDDLIFVAGQVSVDPKTGDVERDDIKKATRQTLDNLKVIIEESGGSLDDVVKVLVYLTDFDDFGKMNEVYEEYFGDSKPARVAVEVSKIGLDAPIEIEAIAAL